MMKATGLKRGPRRKQQQQQPSTPISLSQQQQQQQRNSNSSNGSGGNNTDKRTIVVMSSTSNTTMTKNEGSFAHGQQQQQQQLQQQQQQMRRRQHQQQQYQQQLQQNDHISALTTKNYRLAKELADLRVRYRDEQKNVTRLTMENMNLASRCREAISHVAMLKKELEQQQKRTADALASQREQTQRMADSLTSSMELSRMSTPSRHEKLQQKSQLVSPDKSTATPSSSPSQRQLSAMPNDQDVIRPEDVNMSQLVSTTPSPLRSRTGSSSTNDGSFPTSATSTPSRGSGGSMSRTGSGNGSNQTTVQSAASASLDEKRESPPPDSSPSRSPRRELLPNIERAMDGDHGVIIGNSSGSSSDDDDDDQFEDVPTNDVKKNGIDRNASVDPTSSSSSFSNPTDASTTTKVAMYSTPKHTVERSWEPHFHHMGDDELIDSSKIFPHSASPQAGSSLEPSQKHQQASYNEEFPSDMIDGPFSSTTSPSVPARPLNLVNSIDDFEKSFTTNFPESFSAKERTVSSFKKLSPTKEIYNPFFATPERSGTNSSKATSDRSIGEALDVRSKVDSPSSPEIRRKTSSFVDRTPDEKKTDDPDSFGVNGTPDSYETPPRSEKIIRRRDDTVDGPGRPEKTTSSASRARYERALQPRKKENDETVQLTTSSTRTEISGGADLIQQSQQQKMHQVPPTLDLDALEKEISSSVPPTLSQIEAEVSTPSKSILDLVDEYESPPKMNDQQRPQDPPVVDNKSENATKTTKITAIAPSAREKPSGAGQSIAARLSGVRSLRRNVKQPVSYAEPALNTKLRRGDKFFPKTSPPKTASDDQPTSRSGVVTPDASSLNAMTIQ